MAHSQASRSMDNDRLTDLGPNGGGGYDVALFDHWLAGRTRVDVRSRHGLPRSLLPQSLSPIIKPLPAGRFRVHESNAEMRWEVMRAQRYVVPNADFFVRNHTSTPLIDAGTWSLSVFGTGLRGSVPQGNPVRFSHQDLLDLPARGGLRDRVRRQRPKLLHRPAAPADDRHTLAARRDRGDGLARRPAVRRPPAVGNHPRGGGRHAVRA